MSEGSRGDKPESQALKRATVLVVDDTPENLELMISLLSDVYKVRFAKSGEKALEIAASEPRPDLILLDIMMPEMDGYEVCRRLKSDPATRDIPVIFLTGKTALEDEEKGLKLGAVDYITKPISPPIVVARVANHLNLKAKVDFLRDKAASLEREVARNTKDASVIHRMSTAPLSEAMVLVVDDTPENLQLMTGLLKDLYKVKVAKSGERALEIAASEPHPDLILLDVMMPDMDGYEVCRRLKSNPATRDIPVIFITAKIEMDDEMKGLELGAVDYITKPISPPVMMARVETHLKLKASADFLHDRAEYLERESVWTQLAMEVGRIVLWEVDPSDGSMTYMGNASDVENRTIPEEFRFDRHGDSDDPARGSLATHLSAMDPEDARRIDGLIHEASTTGEPFEFAYRVPGDDGPRWVAGRGKPISFPGGGSTPIIVGASMDITDLKRAQDEVKAAREEARLAQEARKELLVRMTQDSRKFL